MKSPIVIYGAGGFAREVAELIRDINRSEDRWDLQGFLADDREQHGQVLNGLRVLGGSDILSRNPNRIHVAVGVGNPAVKRRLAHQVELTAASFPNLIHPAVVMSRAIELGQGVLITAGNILTANITVDDHVMMNLSCTVGHDCCIHAFASLSPGANISGHVRIGEGTDIGTNSGVIQGVTIGRWSIVGAGAVVSSDLPDNCTAVGVPARVIKTRDEGWYLS